MQNAMGIPHPEEGQRSADDPVTVGDVSPNETIPKCGTDAPGIERNDRPASLSIKWGGDKSSDSSAGKLDNMTDVNQVVRGTSLIVDILTDVNRTVRTANPKGGFCNCAG